MVDRKKRQKPKEDKTQKAKARPKEFDDDEDDADFDQRMADQAKQGDKRGEGKKMALDMTVFGKKEIDWFKIEVDALYRINIIPFRVTQKWYADLLQRAGAPTNRVIGKLEPSLIIPVHTYLGAHNKTVLCLQNAFNQDCPVCAHRFKLRQEDYDKYEATIKDLNISWKCYYNVLTKEGLKVWEVAFSNFEKALRLANDATEETISFASFRKGKAITFRAKEGEWGGRKYPMVARCDFADRKKALNKPKLLEAVLSLDKALVIPTYEEVKAIFLEEEEKHDESQFPPDDEQSDTPSSEDYEEGGNGEGGGGSGEPPEDEEGEGEGGEDYVGEDDGEGEGESYEGEGEEEEGEEGEGGEYAYEEEE